MLGALGCPFLLPGGGSLFPSLPWQAAGAAGTGCSHHVGRNRDRVSLLRTSVTMPPPHPDPAPSPAVQLRFSLCSHLVWLLCVPAPNPGQAEPYCWVRLQSAPSLEDLVELGLGGIAWKTVAFWLVTASGPTGTRVQESFHSALNGSRHWSWGARRLAAMTCCWLSKAPSPKGPLCHLQSSALCP